MMTRPLARLSVLSAMLLVALAVVVVAPSIAGAIGTWAPQSSGTHAALTSVAFADAAHGWAVGSGASTPTIRATTDGGSHWTTQTVGATGVLNSVAFADAAHGWAVGYDTMGSPLILATKDGGSHWTT